MAVTVNVNNKDVKVHFGVKFIKELNKDHKISMYGIEQPMGVTSVYENLQSYDPTAVLEVLRKGSELGEKAAEEYVDSLDKDELKELADSFLEAFMTAPATALQLEQSEATQSQTEMTSEQAIEILQNLNQ